MAVLFRLLPRFICVVACCFFTSLVSGSVVGVQPSDERIDLRAPPPFAIAEMGFRHDLEPRFYSVLVGMQNYEIRVSLLQSPEGMTVTPDGVLEWIPSIPVGSVVLCELETVVEKDGAEIFRDSIQHSILVVDSLPPLLDQEPIVRYDGEQIGWSIIPLSEFDSNETHHLFRWSLIDPPVGVWIDNEGGLHWPSGDGYTGLTPHRVTVRIEYDTARGTVSDETVYSRIVLPRPETVDYGLLRSNRIASMAYGMGGYSVDYGGGWLVAGEPFPGFAWPNGDNPNLGRVRLWYRASDGDAFEERGIFQPASGWPEQAFGASVALEVGEGDRPTRLVVGAPEADLNRASPSGLYSAAGYVYVFVIDADGNWREEARLSPPDIAQSLYFGGWVDLSGETLIASMEGHTSEGINTGALAVFAFNRDIGEWEVSQTLTAPDAGWGDYFSYPSHVDGEWIAAAANEDDEGGFNAGAVHLFRKTDGEFRHQQKLLAPEPESGALFGERIHLENPWLFVSAFREKENRGTVYVYKEANGVWQYQQRLENPFITPGSLFGVGLDRRDDLLAVSAPGFLPTASVDDVGARKGITLYRLDGGVWTFQGNVTRSPVGSPYPHTWGFAVAQVSENETVASMPDYTPSGDIPLAGRLFMHAWPEFVEDPFNDYLVELSNQENTAVLPTDDSDGNGIANLVEWVMGQDPASAQDLWGTFDWRGSRSFLTEPAEDGCVRFYIPTLQRGIGYRADVEISVNGGAWIVRDDVRWEPPEAVFFPDADGGSRRLVFSVVRVPCDPDTRTMLARLRISPR